LSSIEIHINIDFPADFQALFLYARNLLQVEDFGRKTCKTDYCMNQVHDSRRNSPVLFVPVAMLAIWLATMMSLHAAPTLVSVVPADGATGVATSTGIAFTFSEAMNTSQTVALFMNGASIVPTTPVWSSGNTVLTYSAFGGWPSGATISYMFYIAMSALGAPVDPLPQGSFSTGGGGGGGGTGTNAITLLSVGRSVTYNQYSTGTPTLDTNYAYSFIGSTTLASNRTATNITLTMPTTYVSNLMQNPIKPEFWYLPYFNTNQTTFDGLYPSGNYQFNIKAVASNQQVTVTLPLPASMQQPPAPHTTSFTAAQSVDATKAFTISWDAFSGGASTDYVSVAVGNWRSPDPGAAGALNGLATSVQLPANTLQPSSNYDSYISFYHIINTSNVTYGTSAYKVTSTHFNLITTGGAQPTLTNWVKSAGSMAFDVNFSAGQQVTVVSSTNVAATLGQWPILLTTNAPGTRFHVNDPRASTNKALYYRARNGS
jgi:hypothetical protein